MCSDARSWCIGALVFYRSKVKLGRDGAGFSGSDLNWPEPPPRLRRAVSVRGPRDQSPAGAPDDGRERHLWGPESPGRQ